MNHCLLWGWGMFGGTDLPNHLSAPLLYNQIFVAVVSIGGFLFGFDTGVISGALPYIRDDILSSYAGNSAALARWQEARARAHTIPTPRKRRKAVFGGLGACTCRCRRPCPADAGQR